MRTILSIVILLAAVIALGGCTFRTSYSGYHGSYGYSPKHYYKPRYRDHCDPYYGSFSFGYSGHYGHKHRRHHH